MPRLIMKMDNSGIVIIEMLYIEMIKEWGV